MIVEVCWDGLWALSFGLSQFQGQGSRLMCEVALSYTSNTDRALDTMLGNRNSSRWHSPDDYAI
jgi:hypothetical protein